MIVHISHMTQIEEISHPAQFQNVTNLRFIFFQNIFYGKLVGGTQGRGAANDWHTFDSSFKHSYWTYSVLLIYIVICFKKLKNVLGKLQPPKVISAVEFSTDGQSDLTRPVGWYECVDSTNRSAMKDWVSKRLLLVGHN